MSSQTSRVKRGPPVVADGLPGRRVLVDEEIHDVDVAFPRRDVKRRPTVLVDQRHLGTVFQKNLDSLEQIIDFRTNTYKNKTPITDPIKNSSVDLGPIS